MGNRVSFACVAVVLSLAALAAARPAAATDKITVLDIRVVPPTVVSGGVDWAIYGDDNRNATATLEYRRVGAEEWQRGLDLFRLQSEDINAFTGGNALEVSGRGGVGVMMRRPLLIYDVPNMFSGSLFRLEPATEYEVRVTMTDPDGVQGPAVQTARFTTRAEPKARVGGNVYHVYPWNYQGPRIEPSFTGLMAAYFREARHADWSTVGPIRVKPGDAILVHAGVYRDNWHHYGSGTEGRTEARLGTPFDGTYYYIGAATPEAPITIKAAGDG